MLITHALREDVTARTWSGLFLVFRWLSFPITHACTFAIKNVVSDLCFLPATTPRYVPLLPAASSPPPPPPPTAP